MLMNCPEEYDDDMEASRTHPQLLPKKTEPVEPNRITETLDTPNLDQGAQRRSVLAGSGKCVTWNTSSNRADKYNEKVRLRHAECVEARLLRF